MYWKNNMHIKNVERIELNRLANSLGFAFVVTFGLGLIIVFICNHVTSFIKNGELSCIITHCFTMIESATLLIPPVFLIYKSYITKDKNILPFKKISISKFSFIVFVGLGVSSFLQMACFFLQNSINIKAVPTPNYGISIYSIVLSIFSISVVPALIEEIAFRGVILGCLRKYGDWFAIIISSLLFGLVHGNILQFIFTFFLGLFFGYITVKTNSMLPSIIIHFLNNFISVLANIGFLDQFVLFLCSLAIIMCSIIAITYLSIKNINFLKIRDLPLCFLNRKEKITAFFQNPGIITFLGLYFCIMILIQLTS